MNKKKQLTLALSFLIVLGGFATFWVKEYIEKEREEFEEENEEHPEVPMPEEEKKLFLEYLERRSNQITLKSADVEAESSYADGKVKGTWHQKITRSGWHGFRVDNSAYDSLRNEFYVITYAGHLYKLEYENEIKWTLLNHKDVMNPTSNSTANPVFFGTLLPDSTFRLIRSSDSGMEYSDDQGANWISSSGASVATSWSNQIFEITNNGKKRIVLHTYYGSYHYLYFSDDNGATYTESSLRFPISTTDVRIAKPYFTNDVYLWAWIKSSNLVTVYKYNPDTEDYELSVKSSSELAGSNLSSAAATYVDGQLHFYLSTYEDGYNIYYSSDEGVTWEEKITGRDVAFMTLCGDQPGTLLSGFEDVNMSTDYGATWNGFNWAKGWWDMQHMGTYEMAGGGDITLIGCDFGCYVSQTPEDVDSYTWCNDGAYFGMHYDVASNENFQTIHLANQDRGATAYRDTAYEVSNMDLDGTDVLRVAYSNRGFGVWEWFYYGRMRYRDNFAADKWNTAYYDGLGNWWAAPIVASPDPTENAIYAAYGSNLSIFTYNSESGSVTLSEHPFNFEEKFNQEINGFGYSELNRDLWYATLANGRFVYSKDGGDSWSYTSYLGLGPSSSSSWEKTQMVIHASQTDTNTVYYAGIGNYFMVSKDAGKTFTNKKTGLNIYRMRDFAVTPDGKFAFAACGYGGAWVYSFDADRWYQMSDDPVPTVDFTDVEVIGAKNIVRFGTFGSGVIDFEFSTPFLPSATPTELTSRINANGKVELNWNDVSDNEEGFIIERAYDADFVRIDTIGANEVSYEDTSAGYEKTYYYRVRSFVNDTASWHSNMTYITTLSEGVYGSAGWTIIDVSSEEVNAMDASAENAIDNDPDTYWNTEYKNDHPKYPHYIAIDLGEVSTIAGFRYLTRQDGYSRGSVADYNFYITNDTSDWGDPVVSGTFKETTDWQETALDEVMQGRYVKFEATSELTTYYYATVAELAVLYAIVVPEAPTAPTYSSSTSTITLRWTDNSFNESGFIIEELVDGVYVPMDTVVANRTYLRMRNLPSGTTYTLRIRAYNNGGVSEPTETIEASTQVEAGLDELDVSLKVYPNPFSEQLTVKMGTLNSEATVRVIDLKGTVYKSQKVASGTEEFSLNVGEMPSGMYILEIESQGQHITKKIRKN